MEKPFLVGYFTKCLVKKKTLGLISDNLGDLFMTMFPLMVSCKLPQGDSHIKSKRVRLPFTG